MANFNMIEDRYFKKIKESKEVPIIILKIAFIDNYKYLFSFLSFNLPNSKLKNKNQKIPNNGIS